MEKKEKFTWIPFYTELAEKLLEYKDDRTELINFVYGSEMAEYTRYLHKEDKTNLTDIDPFTFMGVFNRNTKWDKRKDMLGKVKKNFSIKSEVPEDFSGIPCLDARNSLYCIWDDDELLKQSCSNLWSIYTSFMNDQFGKNQFDSLMEQKGNGLAKVTMPLFWCKPNKYLSLDSKNIDYLIQKGFSVSVNDYASYCGLVQDLLSNMNSGFIAEKTIPELSYNAFLKNEPDEDDFSNVWLLWDKDNPFDSNKIFMGDSVELKDYSNFDTYEKMRDAYQKAAKNTDVSIPYSYWHFIKNVSKNDYVVVFHSQKLKNRYFHKIWGWGIITSDLINDVNSDYPLQRCVEWKKRFDKPIDNYEIVNTMFFQKTTKIQAEHILKKLGILNDDDSDIQQYTNIISKKKNLILQGAPGTGKTYNTAALALSVCGVKDVDLNDHEAVMKHYGELQKEGRIGFCTFHQSMDYEDFVEGIKPKTENGAITYEVEDGIFKSLSCRAMENQEDSQKTIEVLQKQRSVQEKISDFLSDAQDEGTEFNTITGSKFKIVEFNDKYIVIDIPDNQVFSRISANIAELRALLENDVELKKVGDIKTYFNRKFNTQQDSYTFVIAKEIRKIKTENVSVQKTELQNYVLIIDEINRGNVSKIFGELITLLEADKRIGGEHPIKVTLPYSKEEFGVPSNLYIIGTMNTTDRSVGNIDYAVRRRFAFVTLESKREIVAEKCGEDSKAVQLFDVVKEFLQSHKSDMDFEDLMVGHSYFMADNNDDLQLKLDYEIVPLIREYYKDGIINVSKKDLDDAISTWNAILKS